MRQHKFYIISILILFFYPVITNAQKKERNWDVVFETPPLTTPYTQVGYDGYFNLQKYYFKQTLNKDSTFVQHIYDKIDGNIIGSFKGKYINYKYYSDIKTALCDSIWGTTTYGSKFKGRSNCNEPLGKYQYIFTLYGNYIVLDGKYEEIDTNGFKTVFNYIKGEKQGLYYKQKGLQEFEIGNYAKDLMVGYLTAYRINEYYDTLPVSKYEYVNGSQNGIYEKYWENGIISESGFLQYGQKTGNVTYYDRKGIKIKEVKADIEEDNNHPIAVSTSVEPARGNESDIQSKLKALNISDKANFEGVFVFHIDEAANAKLLYENIVTQKHLSKKELEAIKSTAISNAKFTTAGKINGKAIETIRVLRVSYK